MKEFLPGGGNYAGCLIKSAAVSDKTVEFCGCIGGNAVSSAFVVADQVPDNLPGCMVNGFGYQKRPEIRILAGNGDCDNAFAGSGGGRIPLN